MGPISCKETVLESRMGLKRGVRQLTGKLDLLVMEGDLCSSGRGFESQHLILEGHFSHLSAVKIGKNVCLKRKRGRE